MIPLDDDYRSGPEEAEDRVTRYKDGQDTLILNDLALEAIPDSVFGLKNLKLLELSRNRLATIPASLSHLSALQYLFLSRNDLSTAPNGIAQLSNLISLDLSHNRLTVFPDYLADLTNLDFLNLSGNQLTEIPDPVAGQSTLKTIDLSQNGLCELPEAIADFAHLERLDVSRNQLRTVPESIARLTNLKSLDLSGNKLTTIPDSLASLSEELNVRLEGNPVSGELGEIIRLGWKQLRAYLRERALNATRQWKIKLLLVGEGGVGKTNLLRRLKGEDFQRNLDPTHSLEIRDLTMDHPEEPHISLNFRAWDFGGQDFYHATHQFFYSGKSIFLLVQNARENIQQGKLTSWLDRIQALSPDSPVLLVATWTDKVQPNIPLAELKEKYRNIVGLSKVDNESSNGIGELRETLRRVALTLDHVGQPRPASWMKASEAIRLQPEPYAEFSRFRKIVEEKGVTEFDAFSNYLSHTGEITFFPRNPIYQPEQAELRDWVVLKPDWLLQKVSDVVTDIEIKNKAGVLTALEQQRVWHDCPNLVQEFLLRMMDHFDLAYRTDTHPIRSIVVELCPEDRPPDVMPLWESARGSNEIALEYRFETTIPPGLPTWFIARSHRFTKPERHWRRGALLFNENASHCALLQADLEGRKVVLTARGPAPQNFFALLRDCFEGTLRRFPGLINRVERVIPCPTVGCRGDFKLADLEAFLADGDEDIRCHGCRSKQSIYSLLFGVAPPGSRIILEKIEELGDRIDDQHQELLALIQREFTESFHREQSLNESHCPSVFTLEFERLNSILPSTFEDWWGAMVDRAKPVWLTLYCEQPGAWHPAKSYRIQPQPNRLKALAPHLQKIAGVLKVAGPAMGLGSPIAKAAQGTLLAVAELNRSRREVRDFLGESRKPTKMGPVNLHALRGLLEEFAPQEIDCWGGLTKVLTKQFHYLWLCEEHARPHLSSWPSV